MEIEYEIHIGEVIPMDFVGTRPKQKLLISANQKEIIDTFANITMDKDLNKIYHINDIEFRIYPHFK